MYVITSFGAELGSRKVSPPYCMLRAFADVSTEFSVGTVPIANSVETSVKAPIPGIPVSMVTGHRGLSQLDPLHIAFAGGRREILHACSRFMNS